MDYKPGPKPGRAAQIKADLANYKEEADYLRIQIFRVAAERDNAEYRANDFNLMPLWAKLWFILRGGVV